MNAVTPRLADVPGEDAPAKINLALAVTGRRVDGYHLLESLVVFAAGGDRLEAEAADVDSLVVAGPFASELERTDLSDNLVTRARDALRGHLLSHGMNAPPVALRLAKNLPVASGIGGGSADAAASLRLLARFWSASMTPGTLRDLALSLGADVPMCLDGRTLIARGIGEEVEPLDGVERLPMVLANPRVAVSTPAVFRALASPDNPPLPPLPRDRGIRAMADWVKAARNDLLAPALSLAPQIGPCLAALTQTGALAVSMSGSGATCFGIYASEAEAEQAARRISTAEPGWFVQATISG
jgi:4-diphosphocytidyl-2-C-methyl-D-erythritol kinase